MDFLAYVKTDKAAFLLVQHSVEDPCQEDSWRSLLSQTKKGTLQKVIGYS